MSLTLTDGSGEDNDGLCHLSDVDIDALLMIARCMLQGRFSAFRNRKRTVDALPF